MRAPLQYVTHEPLLIRLRIKNLSSDRVAYAARAGKQHAFSGRFVLTRPSESGSFQYRVTSHQFRRRRAGTRRKGVLDGVRRHRLPPSKDHSLSFVFCRGLCRQYQLPARHGRKFMHARSVPAAALCGPVAFQYGPAVR